MTASEEAIARLPFLKRLSPELPVWKLRQGFFEGLIRSAEPAKIQTLDALGVPGTRTFLVYSEDPADEEAPGQWRRVAAKTWAVPADIELSALVHYLYLGGWVLYSADAPVDEAAISAAALDSPAALSAAVNRLGVRFIVQSFYDDTYWDIALNNQE